MKHNIIKFLVVLNTIIFMISLIVVYTRYSYLTQQKISVGIEEQQLLKTSSSTQSFPEQENFSVDTSTIEKKVPSEIKIRKPKFVYFSSKAKKVALIGSFNNWIPQEMKKTSNNRWEITVEIPEGTYLYNFLVDGKIVLDPNNKNIAASSKGYKSSVLELK